MSIFIYIILLLLALCGLLVLNNKYSIKKLKNQHEKILAGVLKKQKNQDKLVESFEKQKFQIQGETDEKLAEALVGDNNTVLNNLVKLYNTTIKERRTR